MGEKYIADDKYLPSTIVNEPEETIDLWKLITEKKQKFLRQFKKCLAIVDLTCAKRNISRQTYYNWRKSDENFRKIAEDIEESVGDLVKSKLFELIMAGDFRAIKLWLENRHPEFDLEKKKKSVDENDGKIIFTMVIDSAAEDRIQEAEALQASIRGDISQQEIRDDRSIHESG